MANDFIIIAWYMCHLAVNKGNNGILESLTFVLTYKHVSTSCLLMLVILNLFL